MFLRQVSRQLSRNAPKFFRPVTSTATAAMRSMSTAGAALSELASESPHVDVVRYEHKNLKLTLKGVDYNADSLAAGLLECGLIPGDVVLSWLPSHFSEQVCVGCLICYYVFCGTYCTLPSILYEHHV